MSLFLEIRVFCVCRRKSRERKRKEKNKNLKKGINMIEHDGVKRGNGRYDWWREISGEGNEDKSD
jgi:hypothetical protein